MGVAIDAMNYPGDKTVMINDEFGNGVRVVRGLCPLMALDPLRDERAMSETRRTGSFCDKIQKLLSNVG